MRLRRHFTDARNGFDCDPGGGVHADIQRHQLRAGEQGRIEFLQGEVDALYLKSALLQPGAGFGQRKRLPVVVDSSALDYRTIYVSAGRRGLDVEIAATDLVTLTGATMSPIAKS